MNELLTAEMIYAAYWDHYKGAEHGSWPQLGDNLKAHYTSMAAYLNTRMIDNGAAERDTLRTQIAQLNAQIDLLTDGVLQLEEERNAWQQLARAHGGQTATPAPAAAQLLEQAIADFHAQMREMGIPFQEDDHA